MAQLTSLWCPKQRGVELRDQEAVFLPGDIGKDFTEEGDLNPVLKVEGAFVRGWRRAFRQRK